MALIIVSFRKILLVVLVHTQYTQYISFVPLSASMPDYDSNPEEDDDSEQNDGCKLI